MAGNKFVIVSWCKFFHGTTFNGVWASHITCFFLGFTSTRKILYVSNHIYVT